VGGVVAVSVARPTSVLTDAPILMTLFFPTLAANFLGAMGAAWWLARVREGVLLYVFGFPSVIGVIAITTGLTALCHATASAWPAIVAIPVLALLGVLVWRAACRRWMEVEFG
jgi:ABC-type transport system involved in cytochrome c biogenesis permease component